MQIKGKGFKKLYLKKIQGSTANAHVNTSGQVSDLFGLPKPLCKQRREAGSHPPAPG